MGFGIRDLSLCRQSLEEKETSASATYLQIPGFLLFETLRPAVGFGRRAFSSSISRFGVTPILQLALD